MTRKIIKLMVWTRSCSNWLTKLITRRIVKVVWVGHIVSVTVLDKELSASVCEAARFNYIHLPAPVVRYIGFLDPSHHHGNWYCYHYRTIGYLLSGNSNDYAIIYQFDNYVIVLAIQLLFSTAWRNFCEVIWLWIWSVVIELQINSSLYGPTYHITHISQMFLPKNKKKNK